MERIDIPAREARAWRLKAGASFRVIDVEGLQVGDLWAFNEADPGEYHNAPHTRVECGRLFPHVGEQFWSNRRRPILTLVADDSPGVHDMLMAACDPERLLEVFETYPEGERGRFVACGGGPAIAVMMAARARGARHGRVLKYMHSGQISGDNSGVVGYLAGALGDFTDVQ